MQKLPFIHVAIVLRTMNIMIQVSFVMKTLVKLFSVEETRVPLPANRKETKCFHIPRKHVQHPSISTWHTLNKQNHQLIEKPKLAQRTRQASTGRFLSASIPQVTPGIVDDQIAFSPGCTVTLNVIAAVRVAPAMRVLSVGSSEEPCESEKLQPCEVMDACICFQLIGSLILKRFEYITQTRKSAYTRSSLEIMVWGFPSGLTRDISSER